MPESFPGRAQGYRPAFGFEPWLALFLRALVLRLLVFFDIGRAKLRHPGGNHAVVPRARRLRDVAMELPSLRVVLEPGPESRPFVE